MKFVDIRRPQVSMPHSRSHRAASEWKSRHDVALVHGAHRAE